VGQGVYEGRSVMAKSKEEKAAYQRAWAKANKEKISAKNKAYNEANKEKIAALSKAWYEANKEEELAKRKARYEANREEELAKRKAYREANKEKIIARDKAYREANKEKLAVKRRVWQAANREKIRAATRTWQAANREKKAATQARRRALKSKQIPLHLRECPHEKKRLVQIYKLRNIISEATGVQHHVDHMWPLSDGGPHWSGNLQIIPAEENMSKHASVCEETKTTIIKSLYTFESERSI
jgi:hypothetical protein